MNEAARLFTDDAAWYYARYRTPYPQTLFDDLVTYFHLDRKGTLLDLGCGTGEVAVPLASYFENVIAVDTSLQMLEEVRHRIATSNAHSISLVEGTAEEVKLPDSIRLTTIATAFHWMKQSKVLARLYPITEPGGGIAVIWGSTGGWWKTPEVWQQKIKELLVKYIGAERRAGEGTYASFQQGFDTFEAAIKNSPFKTFEIRKFPYSVTRNSEEVLGLLYSRSWGARRYFGDRIGEFEKEAKDALRALDPRERFTENGEIETYYLRKR